MHEVKAFDSYRAFQIRARTLFADHKDRSLRRQDFRGLAGPRVSVPLNKEGAQPQEA